MRFENKQYFSKLTNRSENQYPSISLKQKVTSFRRFVSEKDMPIQAAVSCTGLLVSESANFVFCISKWGPVTGTVLALTAGQVVLTGIHGVGMTTSNTLIDIIAKDEQ